MPYLLLLISHWEEEPGCSGGCGQDELTWVAVKVSEDIASKFAYSNEEEYTNRLEEIKHQWHEIRKQCRDLCFEQDRCCPTIIEDDENDVLEFRIDSTDSTDSMVVDLCVKTNKNMDCCSGYRLYSRGCEFVSNPNPWDENHYSRCQTSPPDFDRDQSTWDVKIFGIESPEFDFSSNDEESLADAVPVPEDALDAVGASGAVGAGGAVGAVDAVGAEDKDYSSSDDEDE